MGSDVVVHLVGVHDPAYHTHIRERLGQMERSWSRFDPLSELNQINLKGGGTTTMSSDLAMALRYATDAWRLTGGRFDPTVATAMDNLGYDRDWREVLRDNGPSQRAQPAPGCAQVEFIAGTNIIVTPPGVRFDLGGLGKGLAADVITNEAISSGIEGICVSVGGDLRCAGVGPDGGPWHIRVRDARGRELATTRFDCGGAIATSSPMAKQFTDGRHHLIDPSTGASTSGGLSHVSVVAHNCATAEVWSKAAMTLAPDQATQLLASHRLGAVMIDHAGEVHTVSATPHLIGAAT